MYKNKKWLPSFSINLFIALTSSIITKNICVKAHEVFKKTNETQKTITILKYMFETKIWGRILKLDISACLIHSFALQNIAHYMKHPLSLIVNFK